MPKRTNPLTPSDVRANIIPAVDLDLQGDTGQPLALYDDINVVLALLSLRGPDRPTMLRGSRLGSLASLVLPDPDAIIGSEGNLVSAFVFPGAGDTLVVDTLNYPNISIFGHSSAAVTLTVNMSAQLGVLYASGISIVLAGASDFGINFTGGVRFVSLHVSAACTLTATLMAKA